MMMRFHVVLSLRLLTHSFRSLILFNDIYLSFLLTCSFNEKISLLHVVYLLGAVSSICVTLTSSTHLLVVTYLIFSLFFLCFSVFLFLFLAQVRLVCKRSTIIIEFQPTPIHHSSQDFSIQSFQLRNTYL
jgi:hypothetical protein